MGVGVADAAMDDVGDGVTVLVTLNVGAGVAVDVLVGVGVGDVHTTISYLSRI